MEAFPIKNFRTKSIAEILWIRWF